MELNFLFGNPVKGKKGGKRMAGRKRTKSAAPKKRKVRSRKNPYLIKGKLFYDDAEIEQINTALASYNASRPKKHTPSTYTAADKAILAEAGRSGWNPSPKKISMKAAQSLVAKLKNDKKAATPAEAKKIDAIIKKVMAMVQTKSPQTIDSIIQNKNIEDEESLLSSLSSALGRRSASAVSKMKDVGPVLKTKLGPLNKDTLMEIAAELKKGNPSRKQKNAVKGGEKMAKGRKKATKRKAHKKAGKKVAAMAAPKKRRKKRKSMKLALTAATRKKVRRSKKAARKYLKAHRRHKVGPKKGRKVALKWKRGNPGIQEAAISIGKIALAGAAAGVALQLANKFAKPMIDKVVPKALADFKVGNAAVGQILLSCLVPGLVAAGLKMVKHPMAQQVSDVIIVTTAANAGQRIAAGLLPGGMAGVEPMLMGVEPMLMGEADFGEADFGDADFGAIEQFSGVEPQLMGEADFGSADFGAVQQYSGYGAIEQFSGDEDYAGEDLDGEDFDGESAHGLG
jgi:hypothetical protein